MTLLNQIFICTLCHYIGEYTLQPERVRLWKRREKNLLFAHILLYITPFFVVYGFGYEVCIIFISHLLLEKFGVSEQKINLIQLLISYIFYLLIPYI